METPSRTNERLNLFIEHALVHTKKDFVGIYKDSFSEEFLLTDSHAVVNRNKDIFYKFLDINKYKNFQDYLEESFHPMDAENFTYHCKCSNFWNFEFKELHSVLEDNTELFSDILEIIREKCS